MAMTAGRRRGGSMADINVTPMIDVLLVLLIVFMVLQEGLRRGVPAQVPPPDGEAGPAPPAPDALVLEVERGGRYFLNCEPVPAARLQGRLAEVFAPRPRKVLFVKGAEDATYAEVVAALDVTRAAGVEVIGLVPRRPAP